MEKIEIKYTAEEMCRKYINKDVELINDELDNAFSSFETLGKGYIIMIIRTKAAIKMLQDKGFKVVKDKSDVSYDDVYKISW